MTTPYRFARRGRSLRAVLALGAVYAVLFAAIIFLDAAPWLMVALALPTLPAIWDLYRNPSAGVTLDRRGLRWHSGRRHGELALTEIDRMRFDTRWDFSIRVTAELRDGKRVRLPYESLPPHRDFEAALQSAGLSVERHHFGGRR